MSKLQILGSRRASLLLMTVMFGALVSACAGGDVSEDDAKAPRLQAFESNRLELTAQVGASATTNIVVRNIGNARLQFDLTHESEWLELEPAEGTIPGGQAGNIVFVATCPLDIGQYNAPVVLKTNDARAPQLTLTIALTCTGIVTGETGTLEVVSQGLPSGLDADISVSGPEGAEFTVTETTTLPHLVPGEYTVSARVVSQTSSTYTPSPASLTVTVNAGEKTRAVIDHEVSHAISTGSLELTVVGLPAGVNAAITVTGAPNVVQSVTQSTTLEALSPGEYAIEAGEVVVGPATYEATSTSVTVQSGQIASATITYTLVMGDLDVTIGGLPSGVSANIVLSGPGGFADTLTASASFDDLAPGTYLTAADEQSDGPAIYRAASQETVVQSRERANLGINYVLILGELEVLISGLPAGVDAAVTVTGPDSFSQLVTSSTELTNLEPGTYQINVDNVTVGTSTYSGTSFEVEVTSDEQASAQVTYTLGSGQLSVAISGLPAGLNAAVTVTGPNNFSQLLTTTITLNNLAPGAYTVTAASVTSAQTTYTGNMVVIGVSSGTTAHAPIVYQAVNGSLSLTVSGLPAGLDGDVLITGPNGFNTTRTASATLNDLLPGDYTITGRTVTSGASSYSGTTVLSTVSSGQQASATVTYTRLTGNLTVTVSGLPVGTNASVVVTGPDGYNQALVATTTLSNLNPGTYTITASNVVVGLATYSASSSSASVVVGATAASTVTYALGSGQLSVAISGLAAGLNAAVTVTGPNNFSQPLTATTTLNNLAPGSYTVTAASVTSAPTTYTGNTGNPVVVDVSSGATANAAIIYQVVNGSLALTVSGLPAGLDGDVLISGPNGFTTTRTASATLTDLVPGDYTITGRAVTSGASTYNGTAVVRTVSSSQQASATVTYTRLSSALTVNISGLPGGTNANVVVTGPGGYSQLLTATQTLNGLDPGDYTVTTNNVTVAPAIYAGNSTQVTIVSEGSETANIAYQALPGSLTINIVGLDASTTPSVTVTGPNSFSQTIATAQTLNNLAPGTYTVTANNVSNASGAQYTGDVTSPTVSSSTTATATATYTVVHGSLTVTIGGLLSGMDANVTVNGPSGYTTNLTATATLANLVPGQYTIIANSVTDSLSNIFTATVTTSPTTVSSSATASALVTYINPLIVTNENNTGAGSLRNAVTAARPNSTITFAANVAKIALTSGPIALTKHVTIDGNVELSGNLQNQIFTIGVQIDVVLKRLTFVDGRGDYGGAIDNLAADLTLDRCTFVGNEATVGGGAIYNGDFLTIIDSYFLENVSEDFGGAIVNVGVLLAYDAYFVGNSSANSGAIAALGFVYVDSTVFWFNSATNSGGAVRVFENVEAVFENSEFSENSAGSTGYGGAILSEGSLEVVNSTLAHNSALIGGAICTFDQDTTLINVTISANTAADAGGGLWQFGDAGTSISLGRSIVASNFATNGGPDVFAFAAVSPYVSLGYNVIGNGAGTPGFTNATNGDRVGSAATPVNPGLEPLANNGGRTWTMALTASSPARARVPAANCLDTNGNTLRRDQRGVGRPTHSFCDSGAFEFGGLETFSNLGSFTSYLTGSFVGNQGITWNYEASRSEQSYPIDGRGLMFQGSTAARLYSQTLQGGISSFSVKMRKAHANNAVRRITLHVNGALIATSEEFGNATSADEATIYTFAVSNINISGPVVIELRNASLGQIVVDDLRWSGYAGN
ncbi:MAG: hypothetical protein H0U74_14605 [Bradymonadaceae bacterium]|nr:hypothetical protein [Lujinxingiaceae bacterium]